MCNRLAQAACCSSLVFGAALAIGGLKSAAVFVCLADAAGKHATPCTMDVQADHGMRAARAGEDFAELVGDTAVAPTARP